MFASCPSACLLYISMRSTARISNIAGTTTKDELLEFLKSKGLARSPGQRVSYTKAGDGKGIAIASFDNEAAYKKALALPRAERHLNEVDVTIDDDFNGFTTLAEGSQIDIVALHGLNGHAFRSWEFHGENGENFMWLRDSLPEQLPGARIMTYGYNANVLSDVSTGRLRTFAETFLERLYQVRASSEAHDRPLILIAHSMGGLVVKQALILANTRADSRFSSILNSVTGIVFVGTPHSGGNGVDTAQFVANLVRVFNVEVRGDLVKSLDPRSMVLFDLTDDFRQLIAAKGIEIATLFEIKKTPLGLLSANFSPFGRKWIVEERSAILGVAGERKVAINATHAHPQFHGQFACEHCRGPQRVLQGFLTLHYVQASQRTASATRGSEVCQPRRSRQTR
ncbi:hypothetical protein BDZ89DRAFT_1077817 [Hymenopellis radicata]|nr:hypothetical protein BDZ89DRAFT_1077817 [Hymenopellis radicata]